MSYLFRRLPLSRLLLLCALVVVLGASLTAIAFALGGGPTPPPKPLPQAIHDALTAQRVEGVSASVTLTDHLLEGASLAGGGSGSGGGAAGSLSSNPLLTGGSGRLWIAKDGRARLELQSEQGDTQIVYDGHTVSLYDAATNTLYRYTPPAGKSGGAGEPGAAGTDAGDTGSGEQHETPSVAKIEAGIARLGQHANISQATPTDVAGQPAYTVRIAPKEGGSMIARAELSWDAVHGVPLRTAIYSTSSSTPAIELAASQISYGPVDGSVFEFTAPANAKVEDVKLPEGDPSGQQSGDEGGEHPRVRTVGHGVATVAIGEGQAKESAGQSAQNLPEGLQQVKIDGVSASELPTELGTVLSFERAGVRYLLAGAVSPANIEAIAKGL
jgi:outer membrane lipoprotein-sorting protein